MKRDLSKEAIRIGTIADKKEWTADYIRAILPHGFESFQIAFSKALNGINLADLAPGVLDALGDTGAVISALGVYGNPLEKDDDAGATLGSLEHAIDHARDFGCDIVGCFAGRIRGVSIPESIPRFREIFGELARRAEDRGVRIAFENCPMGGDWSQGDHNIAHSPAAWELMFDAVPSDALGLEWEPCHQMCQLIDPIPQLGKWVSKIVHVHGKDATIKNDVLAEHGAYGREMFAFHRHPGFGDCNWTDIISELRAGGYRGSIDIEGWHDAIYGDDLEMTGQVGALHHLRTCRGGDGYYVPNPEGFF